MIPFAPVMQYVGEKPIEQMTLHVYYINGEHISYLYEDAGEGYGYTENEKVLKTFTVFGDAQSLVIKQRQKGEYNTYQSYKIVLHTVPFDLGTLQIGEDEAIELTEHTFEVSSDFRSIEIIGKPIVTPIDEEE